MQGPEALLVDFASATIGSNQYHPIDRDHSDMVKFNNVDDSNYRAVLSYVRQLNGGFSSTMPGILHYVICPLLWVVLTSFENRQSSTTF